MRISNIEQGISNYEVTLRTPESAGAIYQRRLEVMPDAPLRHSTFLVRHSIFVLVGEGETLSQQHCRPTVRPEVSKDERLGSVLMAHGSSGVLVPWLMIQPAAFTMLRCCKRAAPCNHSPQGARRARRIGILGAEAASEEDKAFPVAILRVLRALCGEQLRPFRS